MKKRLGFTLVEMLTVVVIIGILAAITMRLMVYVNQKMGRTRASRDIEQIKHALTEFYACYGIYPPVSTIVWEYELNIPAAKPNGGMRYKDGLAKYLYNDAQTKKWIHFVEEVRADGVAVYKDMATGAGFVAWSNNTTTLIDPWGKTYIYATSDPYQTFKVYSAGPDGKDGTADDIGQNFTE